MKKNHRVGVQKENRRYDHKRDRQAAKAVLRGDHPRQNRSDTWSHKSDLVPLPDDATASGRGSKYKGRHQCKRNKGGTHKPVYVPTHKRRRWQYWSWECERCHKHLYGQDVERARKDGTLQPPGFTVNGEPVDAEHWTYTNILARLTGHRCGCSSCPDVIS